MFEIESNTHKNIKQNLKKIMSSLERNKAINPNQKNNMRLMAVTKTHPISLIESAYAVGLRDFGESYANEAIEKITYFYKKNITDAIWHFIGPLQSNKTRQVANYFDWVHSVDRLKIAQRLSEQRSSCLAPIQLCIQVNISHETGKNGCAVEELLPLALEIIKLPHLKLRGLMCIPKPINLAADFNDQRKPFRNLAILFNQVKTQLPIKESLLFDTLSMGMSDDFECAIAEGSNCIRLGSALFGKRF